MWKLLISVALACLCTQTMAQGFSQTALQLPDTISSGIFEIGISSARVFAQDTYDDVSLDTHLDTLFVLGLKIVPFPSDNFYLMNVIIYLNSSGIQIFIIQVV